MKKALRWAGLVLATAGAVLAITGLVTGSDSDPIWSVILVVTGTSLLLMDQSRDDKNRR